MHAIVKISLPMTSVLFVCMGNICRSPTAEAVFRHRAGNAGIAGGLLVDSAGTHERQVGNPPDRRATAAAARRGYDLTALRARQVTVDDFDRFEYILAMDTQNLRDLERLRPRYFKGNLGRLLDFAPSLGLRDIADPWAADPRAFETVLDQIEAGTAGPVEYLRRRMAADAAGTAR
jgi:protein-tyrosine phosphatase